MKFEYDNKRKTSPIMELQDTVETQAAAAAEQLISNYFVENPADYIIEEMPDLFNTTLPPSLPLFNPIYPIYPSLSLIPPT